MEEMNAPTARRALLAGVTATAAAGLVMGLARALGQVRTLPERLLEWVLLFVPLDVFEAGIQRFGFDAKKYALWGCVLLLMAGLAGAGALVLRSTRTPWRLAAAGLALWLVLMAVVMPLTGAGFFAGDLVGGTWPTLLGYLGAALAYGGTLALFGDAEPATRRLDSVPTAAQRVVSRRSALAGLGGSAAALGVGVLMARSGPRFGVTRVVVLDPQEPVPSGGLDPRPHPLGQATAEPTPSAPTPTETTATATTRPATAAAAPSAVPTTAPTPRPTATPARPAVRALARDKDGAVVAAARKPGELAELITPAGTHYVVSKNPVADPTVKLEDWRLVVDGDVNRPIQLDYQSLRNLPAVEVTKTLECISNFVAKCELAPFGCDLISTAKWRGARLADVIGLAGGLKAGVVSLATIGADEYTTALPIEAALDPDTLIVYEMNGEPLPVEHGYPARVLVPGRYGLKNAKWVVALRPMRREFVDWYGQRNWSKTGVVRTMTRIDTPAPGAVVLPGDQRVAGVAYAGDRGVTKVEFSADGGKSWQTAELAEKPAGADAWVRWFGKFTMPGEGALTLMSRATDGAGTVQEEPFSLPQPDGGAGWHAIEVKAK